MFGKANMGQFCVSVSAVTAWPRQKAVRRALVEEKTHHVCQYYDLVTQFFGIQSISYELCKLSVICRYKFLSFSVGSQTSEHELFLDPKIFEKGQIYYCFFGKWTLILLYFLLYTPLVCPFLQHMVYLITLLSDQGSTYSGDLESEAVSTPHSWEDELNHYALRSNALPEPDPELKQFSKGDVEQDLEADFPSGQCNVKKKCVVV